MGTGTRAQFPKRAVITAGMPYGNKDLHFGHIGGVFVQADVYARFLRDRIGAENVIFVSGTDCYGSPIVEYHRKLTEKGEYTGDLPSFVEQNHGRQRDVLTQYHIAIDLFAASGLGRSGEIHREMCSSFFDTLFKNGFLEKIARPQFFDTKVNAFLNGRQVMGRCPVNGCSSEQAYADECSLGHQYEPTELIDPVSTVSGEKPAMRDVTNWYLSLPRFQSAIEAWLKDFASHPAARQFAVLSIQEFLEPPSIFVKRETLDTDAALLASLPAHDRAAGKGLSDRLSFRTLADMEKARALLAEKGIRYRTGKTLVPFRLSGNIAWGVPVPEKDGLAGLTWWVWPESLIAPISFTKTYLESMGKGADEWKHWWCSKDSGIYQFIGEDNVYFYGPAEAAMFMGVNGKISADVSDGELSLPDLVVNKHLLFLSRKASSSSEIKPPMARDLLKYYTPDQLRAHFFSLGLGQQNVSFMPKPLNPAAKEKDGDPVLKEGNLLSNAFNRAVRSCFYTIQRYTGGKLPEGNVSPAVKEESDRTILLFEAAMHAHNYNAALSIVDVFVKSMNRQWAERTTGISETNIPNDAIIDGFHMMRTAAVLLHPIAPEGTEMIREHLNIGTEFWSWEHIFESIPFFMKDASHRFKELPPRVDFFRKHASQV
ncbi:MAG: class I tRNA ligase family protein [Spirochaetota bacterium]